MENNKEICMNCKYDMECLCKNEFSEKYNEMVHCDDSCEYWEDEDE